MQQGRTEIQSADFPFIGESSEISAKDEGVKKHLWTQDEYYKMAKLGFFHGKRVELIEGEIIEMSPMKALHATAISLLNAILLEVFKEDFIVRIQMPMSFGKISEPEPDIAVAKGKIRDFIKSHPKTAELIVEISDATLNYDRSRKASLYAKNKIQDYWIVNLRDRRLEIYRRPMKEETSFYGFSYAETRIFKETEKVSPLAKPEAKIKIADLLP